MATKTDMMVAVTGDNLPKLTQGRLLKKKVTTGLRGYLGGMDGTGSQSQNNRPSA